MFKIEKGIKPKPPKDQTGNFRKELEETINALKEGDHFIIPYKQKHIYHKLRIVNSLKDIYSRKLNSTELLIFKGSKLISKSSTSISKKTISKEPKVIKEKVKPTKNYTVSYKSKESKSRDMDIDTFLTIRDSKIPSFNLDKIKAVLIHPLDALTLFNSIQNEREYGIREFNTFNDIYVIGIRLYRSKDMEIGNLTFILYKNEYGDKYSNITE